VRDRDRQRVLQWCAAHPPNEIYAKADAPDPTGPRQRGGINIWEVSDPEHLQLLVAHAGDYTDPDDEPVDQALAAYYTCAWTDSSTSRTYVSFVTDKPTTDIVIMEITDPRQPVMVNALDLRVAPFHVTGDASRGLISVFGTPSTCVRLATGTS